MVVLTRGERQHRGDVVGFQVGIVGQDFVVGHACCQKIEQVLHTDTKTANARASSAHGGIDGDAIERAHLGTGNCSVVVAHSTVSGARLRPVSLTLEPVSHVRICANKVVAGVGCSSLLLTIRSQDPQQFAAA